MHINDLPKEFDDARPVMQAIEEAGYQAYFVGGSVRDTILGLPIHDVDIASSAYPAEIKAIFRKTVDTGIEHGTVMVLDHGHGYEVTTFRTESGYQDYRRPDHVEFVRSLSEDLKRRDFTINALAMRENGEVIDLFNGIEDLDHHLIRAVGDPNVRFNEDALRMMRAVRFASKLNFKIDADTFAAIKRHSGLLDKIAVERIHEEFVKMMLGQDPNRGLMDMVKTDLFRHVPGLASHEQTLIQISDLNRLHLNDEVAVWTLLAAKLNLFPKQIENFLKQWKTANQIIKATKLANRALKAIIDGKVDAWLVYESGLVNMKIASSVANNLGNVSDIDQIIKIDRSLPIHSKHELKVNGKILIQNHVVDPGPKLGEILSKLEQLVVKGKVDNDYASLIECAKNLIN